MGIPSVIGAVYPDSNLVAVGVSLNTLVNWLLPVISSSSPPTLNPVLLAILSGLPKLVFNTPLDSDLIGLNTNKSNVPPTTFTIPSKPSYCTKDTTYNSHSSFNTHTY